MNRPIYGRYTDGFTASALLQSQHRECMRKLDTPSLRSVNNRQSALSGARVEYATFSQWCKHRERTDEPQPPPAFGASRAGVPTLNLSQLQPDAELSQVPGTCGSERSSQAARNAGGAQTARRHTEASLSAREYYTARRASDRSYHSRGASADAYLTPVGLLLLPAAHCLPAHKLPSCLPIWQQVPMERLIATTTVHCHCALPLCNATVLLFDKMAVYRMTAHFQYRMTAHFLLRTANKSTEAQPSRRSLSLLVRRGG